MFLFLFSSFFLFFLFSSSSSHNCAESAILPVINERYLTVHLPELAAELFGVIGNFTITLRR